MDLWHRGIHMNALEEGSPVHFDGLLSPYSQLFPGDPLQNAKRWNILYAFPGQIDRAKYQAMEFYAGSDAALRLGSLNGESIVGLYDRYGFVGEGIVGVVPTRTLTKACPEFFHPDCYGLRALVSGTLSKCPAQHGLVAQSIAVSAGVAVDMSKYRDLWYMKIHAISPCTRAAECTTSLLGSPWAVTQSTREQYLVQYGYINDRQELSHCIDRITHARTWKSARVFFDDLKVPSQSLSFKRQFIC